MVVAGAWAGAAGFVGAWAAGLVPAAGGACLGGGDCASEISASVNETDQMASSVFISEPGIWCDPYRFRDRFSFIADDLVASRAKLFIFFGGAPFGTSHLLIEISLLRGCKASLSSCCRRAFFSVAIRNAVRDHDAVPQARPIANCCFQLIAGMNRTDARGRSS